MSSIELNEDFFAEVAGWGVVRDARSLLGGDKVLSSNWSPPLLKGVVQDGAVLYRAGLVIKGSVDIDNVCSCRSAREAGIICAHSVAVGLHLLQRRETPPRKRDTATPFPGGMARKPVARQPEYEPEPEPGPKLKRARKGEAVEISVILPTTLAAGLERGKVMVRFEGRWKQGKGPLSGLPMNPIRPVS